MIIIKCEFDRRFNLLTFIFFIKQLLLVLTFLKSEVASFSQRSTLSLPPILHVDTTTCTTISSASDRLTRKKLGKKSFIVKQERGKLQPQTILTPGEIKELVRKNEARTIGSSYYLKAWNHWRVLAIASIRYELYNILPYAPDKEKFESLFFQLGVAADEGIMPSFEDEGARAAYALEFFCRARNLADIFNFDTFNPKVCKFSNEWMDAILNTPMLQSSLLKNEEDLLQRSQSSHRPITPYRVSSLGGGPGFDFVGIALAATFNSSGRKLSSPIHAKVFDYELGWGPLVDAMGAATIKILQEDNHDHDLSCRWGGKCDITKPMAHPHNDDCRQEVTITNLWTCQFCIAENVQLLRESSYIFFRDLFELAPGGTLFIFTETTPRIWPQLIDVIDQYCKGYMEVGFNKQGRQILLRKATTNSIKNSSGSSKIHSIMMNDDHFNQLSDYIQMDECHDKKINSGYQRNGPKIRGLK